MRRGVWAAVVWAVALGVTGGAGAAEGPRNPELMARGYFGPDANAEAHRALTISRLTVEVRVLGGMAETTVTAQIDNPTSGQLEGDFTFDLPAGSVVTGYALNVGDAMVDGVLQAPRKARVTYEATVRRGVDPGLAEVTREGGFRTRVSPILPGTGRTVRLTFVTPFDAARPYRLPIVAPEALARAVVVVRAPQKDRAAEVAGDLPLTFVSDAQGLETRGELSGRPLSGTLELRPKAVASGLTLSRHADGEVFYDLADAAPAGAAAGLGRLRIYWDASRSRADDDHAAEIELIRRYVAQARPGAVELVQVSDVVTPGEAASAEPEALAARLQRIAYRGATSYRALAAPAAADVCLLVSDGRPSLDAYGPRNMGCRLYTISSTRDANGPLLAAFARASGGTWLDLAARGGRELLAQAIQGGPAVVSVTDAQGRPVAFTILPAPRGRYRLVGPAPEGGELHVRLSDGSVRRYRLDGPVSRHDGAGALWGASRVADLAASDRADGDAVLALSRRYRVASEQASFLVLESAWDYAQAGVEPPASLGKAMLVEYAQARREADAEAEEARKERLGKVIASWTEQKAWWARSFDPRARSVRRKDAELRRAAPVAAPPALAAPAPSPPGIAPPAAAGVASLNEVQEVVTTAARIEGPADITLEVKPWDPQRPYLTALKAAPPERFWTTYEAQAKQYGDLPAYYLDVAEMLFRAGRAQDARRVALEAAEVPAADASTLMTLAERLTRYGDPQRAMWVYEQVAFLQPDRPQPLRSLALALVARAERPGAAADARGADYRRALELLSKVILTPWNGDYDGIELVALMEANRIVPKLQALGVAKPALDPRLVARLDVDVRVVLEWNTDATDMDLWVDEPTGERAIYSNPLTAIGGRLSNDMTGGYGPEEYLLRRAPNGTYEVRINVFATDRLNPNGATTVRATLFRNYGRPDEAREVIDLDLKGGDEDESQALVGKLQVRSGR